MKRHDKGVGRSDTLGLTYSDKQKQLAISALILQLLFYYCCGFLVCLFFLNFLIFTSNGDNLYNLLKVSCSVHGRVGFRMLFHLCLFADEAGVEMWWGCVCWLRGWGLTKAAVPSLRPTSLSNIVVSHSDTRFTPVFMSPCVSVSGVILFTSKSFTLIVKVSVYFKQTSL